MNAKMNASKNAKSETLAKSEYNMQTTSASSLTTVEKMLMRPNTAIAVIAAIAAIAAIQSEPCGFNHMWFLTTTTSSLPLLHHTYHQFFHSTHT